LCLGSAELFSTPVLRCYICWSCFNLFYTFRTSEYAEIIDAVQTEEPFENIQPGIDEQPILYVQPLLEEEQSSFRISQLDTPAKLVNGELTSLKLITC
jgi:hypothetical protein